MLLVADVGNTNAMFGLYEMHSDTPVATVRSATQHDRTPDEWYAILEPMLQAQGHSLKNVTGFVLSSVVPPVTRWLSVLSRNRLGVEPIVVSASLDLGLPIDADFPEEVGADRIVNSMAAIQKFGAPVIAVDFGTALNFDVVDHRGHYLGGALAPGLVVALEAMTSRAAKLFSVDLVPPPHAIGTNTTNAIQSGLVLGYISLVEGMISRLSAEIEGTPKVVVTGGYSELFANNSRIIDAHDPNLTIDGLRIVWERLGKPTPQNS